MRIIGLILLIIAVVLALIIIPIGWIYGNIKSIFTGSKKDFNKQCAISIDQTGNAICGKLFNDVLITKNGYQFSNPDETISSVIGKNYMKGTLTIVGRILNGILNNIQKDHTIKSIDNTVNQTTN